jgi:phage terminase large subunit GpA-like protein
LDEVDAYPPDADSEGDPLTLAIQRTATFARRKILIVSTPTVKGLSRIEKEFENTDQRYFFVPCPHCGHFQTLKWEGIHYDSNLTEVTYVCENCKGAIRDHHKTEMLSKGEWRATNKEKISDKVIGFHLSSLYSPVGWLSWEACVQNYEMAKDNEQLLKAWTNTTLGLTWEEKGDSPDWGVLFDRREHYRIGTVPQGAYVLTAGVDVQNDRLEAEIVGWGQNLESWSIDYRIIYGSPANSETWQKLSQLLEENFESEDGVSRRINMLAVDTGFATQEVYNWVRSQSFNNVMAIKGVDNSLVPLNSPTKVDINYKGKKISGGVRLWKLGVSILKGELYGWLKKTKREDGSIPHGYCHFPEHATEYFKQLTAEQLVTKIVKGYPKREWQKTRDRNEALDCRVYARAATIALGLDRWGEKKWDKLINDQKASNSNSEDKVKHPRVVRSRWM